MNLLVSAMGGFFFLEGLANIVWWHFNPPQDKTNSKMQAVWEAGRVVRTVLGAVLVVLGLLT